MGIPPAIAGLAAYLAVLVGVWWPVHVSLNTRSYVPERQDLSPQEGNYTLDEYFDMMAILSER